MSNEKVDLILEACHLILQVNIGNLASATDRDKALELWKKIQEALTPKESDSKKRVNKAVEEKQ